MHHEMGENAWIKQMLDQDLSELEENVLEHNAIFNVVNVKNELHEPEST